MTNDKHNPRGTGMGILKTVLLAVAIFVVFRCMMAEDTVIPVGSNSSGDRSAPGIVCDRFELKWEVDGTDLLLAIDTDLPDEANLSVSVGRTYFEVGNESAYSRDYFDAFERVGEWRKPRRISLSAKAWKADLATHKDNMARLGSGLAFEVDHIDDNVSILAMLTFNQDDPRFGGDRNPNLSGDAVGRHTVEAEASFPFPLTGPPLARSSRYVAYDELVKGESYRLSDKTPLKPDYQPVDPLAAIAKMRELPAGSVVRVTRKADKQGNIWYEVVLVKDQGITGWVNSIALMGQDIESTQ